MHERDPEADPAPSATDSSERVSRRAHSTRERRFDVAVVGAGLVGLATARACAARGARVLVLEAEDRVAAHQSGRNSGVIHSGLYYAPDSLKARLCRAGRAALIGFCREHGVSHAMSGKAVVATREDERPRLDELERRGRANGLTGLARLSPAQLREREPWCAGLDALWVADAGVVDFAAVARALRSDLEREGHEVVTGGALSACRRETDALTLETAAGVFRCRGLIGCAGLEADRVARRCGLEPGVRIVPFRGEYRALAPAKAARVRGLIYPVPDPRLPFLGVHLTRRVDGRVEVGPNAVVALGRHAYAPTEFSLRDLSAMLAWPGTWRLGARLWKTALGETRRALDPGTFAAEAARLMPGITTADLEPAPSGVRAMAVARDGRMIDDFHLVEGERMVHVLSAPSPAATACLAIGDWIAATAAPRLGLAA
jgi:L-2-hydroxyglutarate oxidase